MYKVKSINNQGDTSHISYQLISKHISFCLLTATSPLLANPAGGDVVGGSATIDYGTTTVITQHTDKAIVNWQDFSINQNETTQFVQPSSSSVILNRVVGNNASEIMGKLQSNGTVFLVNPNGIVFGKDAVVDVGGLVASTASISNQHFMEGNYRFTDAPDNSSIINEGHITVAQTGYAALVAPNVVNAGVINATLGEVVLASGKAFTADLYGDNLITLDASALVESATVKNSGVILADGGKISMSAAGAKSLVESVINMDGYIQANSVGTKQGKVVLIGNDNTTVNIAGNIDVSGTQAGETGGTIQITAGTVKLKAGSSINASGDTGGGLVQVGGEYQGGGQLAHAQYLTMDEHALIDASAISTGNGGQVILWSDQHTIMNGQILAKGGELSGNGGLVETSSKMYLDFVKARINTHAANGLNGTWLIDPVEINVDDTYAGTLTTNLLSGNVTIQTSSAGNDITFTNSTIPVSFSANTFTAIAHNDIIINAGGATVIQNSGSGAINFRADSDATTAGTITFTSGNIVSSGSGAVNFFYNPAAFPTATNYAGDVTVSGTFTPYMLVNTATDLQNINTNLSGTYALNTDIDVDASIPDFTSLGGESGGTFTGVFTGSILGTQYTISDLNISAAGFSEVGLFGDINGATLNNIQVSNATVTGSSSVGGLIGESTSSTLTGTLSLSSGTVSGTGANVGGLIGRLTSTTSSANLSNGASVTGTNGVGGIVAVMQISSSLSGALTNTGNVTGTVFNVGGIAGWVNNSIISGNIVVGGASPITIGSSSGSGQGYGYVIGNMGAGSGTSTSDLTSQNITVASNVSFSLPGNLFVGGILGALGASARFSGFPLYSSNYSIPTVNAPNSTNVGSVIGGVYNGSLVDNLHSLANVVGSSNVGGVIGTVGYFAGFPGTPLAFNMTANITNTHTVTGVNNTGGVIGISTNTQGGGSVNFSGNLTSSGTVSATGTDVGGIIGELGTNSVVQAAASWSTSAGSVTGASNVGGLVGNVIAGLTWSATSTFSNAATVTGTTSNTGGIFGTLGLTINNSLTNTGSVTGSANVGGIAGNIGAAGGLNQAQMTSGTVTGNAQVGGIAGTNAGSITDALFGGILGTTGGSPIEFGGIAGNNTGTITNTLAVGTYNTSAATDVGALVGNNTGTVNTSYFDTRLFSTGIGTGTAGGTGYSTNLEFYTQASYIGFSFPGIWTLSGTNYYASLTFCSTGCQLLLPVTPPTPTPTPTPSSNTVAGVVTTIANNQTSNMTYNTVTYDLTSLNVQNFMDAFGAGLDALGLTTTFLNDVTFLQTETTSANLTSTEQTAAAEEELQTVVEALTTYYCGTTGG